MKKSFKNLMIAVLAFATVIMVSSCNRGGYGCPYELKAPTSIFSISK